MRKQHTIKEKIDCSGIGLHSGEKVSLTFKPAPENTGIIFIRKDRGNHEIEASYKNVNHLQHATSLKSESISIETVEHLLAAAKGMKIDNLIVEADAPEIPIFDGSAASYIYLFREAGVKAQSSPAEIINLTKPCQITENGSSIAAYPSKDFKVSYTIDFDHPVIRRQEYSHSLETSSFINKIAGARTFGFLKDVEKLRKNGLAKGGSLENAIVIAQQGILNQSLRFNDEFVRHKILDAIGDFVLLGSDIKAHIVAKKAGHSLHFEMVRKIMKSEECWVYESEEESTPDKEFSLDSASLAGASQ